MKITLEVPDPIFQTGDVICWGEGKLIVHIYGIEYRGSWCYRNQGLDAWPETGIRYLCAVQGGCGPTGKRIRPGTCTSFPETGNPSHQLCDGSKIKWDEPIIDPDTMDNIKDRVDAWDLSERK